MIILMDMGNINGMEITITYTGVENTILKISFSLKNQPNIGHDFFVMSIFLIFSPDFQVIFFSLEKAETHFLTRAGLYS